MKLQGFDTSGTIIAEHIDQAFWINIWVSVALFASVVLPMLWFAWKYRESNVKNEDIENFTHHTALELTWTLIPTALLMVFFWYGYTSMVTARTMPDAADSIVVELEGKKWSWNYTYPANANGFVHKTAELYVPKSQNVILNMHAPVNDVIHAYYVPAFRMKEDVVPGRVTKQWFNSDVIGSYDVECAEYCGTNHSYMLSKIHVVEPAEYEAWFNSEEKAPAQFAKPMSKGQEVFEGNGCNGCHTVDGGASAGPTLLGVMDKRDRAYIKEAILEPNKVIVDGFAPMMPATDMSDEDIDAIISYLKEAAAAKGKEIVEANGCTGCHTTDGTPSAGPSFKGLGSKDFEYIKEAIRTPDAVIAEGFAPMMPATEMSDEEISEVHKYLKAL